MIDVSKEILFRTSRSGGKGGQNVNKVETSVEGYFSAENSEILSDSQKKVVVRRLKNKINKSGYLVIRSQKERSQLLNKKDVIFRMNSLINHAMIIRKKRVATKPTRTSIIKRLEDKKRRSSIKESRKSSKDI